MLDFGFDLALRFIKNQMINKHLSSSVFFRALNVSPFIYLLTLSKMKNSKKIDVDLDWKVQYVIFCSFRQVRIGCFLKVIDFGRIIFNVFFRNFSPDRNSSWILTSENTGILCRILQWIVWKWNFNFTNGDLESTIGVATSK